MRPHPATPAPEWPSPLSPPGAAPRCRTPSPRPRARPAAAAGSRCRPPARTRRPRQHLRLPLGGVGAEAVADQRHLSIVTPTTDNSRPSPPRPTVRVRPARPLGPRDQAPAWGGHRRPPDHEEPVLTTVRTDFGATLIELTGEDDHVHVWSVPTHRAAAKLANSLKGVSSHGCAHGSGGAPTATTRGPLVLRRLLRRRPSTTLRQHVDRQRGPPQRRPRLHPYRPERPSWAVKDRACASKSLVKASL